MDKFNNETLDCLIHNIYYDIDKLQDSICDAFRLFNFKDFNESDSFPELVLTNFNLKELKLIVDDCSLDLNKAITIMNKRGFISKYDFK